MPRIVLSAVLALTGTACADREALELPVEVGDVLAVAHLDESGAVTTVERVEIGVRRVQLEVPSESDLIVFHLPRARFVDGEGSPISDELWAGFEVVRAGEGATSGACGRAQVPAVSAPQTVFPGDRARVPAWAEARLQPRDGLESTAEEVEERIASARAEIELAWPGPCDCVPTAAPPRVNVEVCTFDAPAAALEAREFAISDRGTAFGASLGFVLRAPVDGPPQLRPVLPAMKEIELITPTPNDGILLVSSLQTLFSAQGAELRYFDPELNEKPVFGAPPVRANDAFFRPDGSLVFIGRRARNTSVFECDAVFDERSLSLSCVEATLEGGSTCPLLNLQASGRLLFPGLAGQELLLTSLGVVAERDLGAGSFRCIAQPGRDDPRWTLSATVTIEGPEIVAAESLAPDRFFAVVHAGGNVPDGQVQTALVFGAVVRDARGAPERVDYTLLETTVAPDVGGHGLRLLPGRPISLLSVRTEPPGFVAVVYDQDGRRTGGDSSWEYPSPPRVLLPEISRRITGISLSPDENWALVRDEQYELHRGPSSGEDFTSVGGRDPRLAASTGLVAPLDAHSVLALSEDGAFRLRPGPECGRDDFEPIVIDGPLPAFPSGLIRADGAAPRFLVLAGRNLARLDLVERRSRTLSASLETSSWVTAAPMGSERFVLLDQAGQLYVLSADDVLSPVAEAPSSEGRIPYLTLGGRDGVVWAGGFGRLDRLRLVGPGELRIEPVLDGADRTAWDDVERDRRRPPFLTGVGVRCRSSAIVHSAEDLNVGAGLSVSDSVRMFELGSDVHRLVLSNPPSFENFSEALATEQGIFAQITWVDEVPISIFPHLAGTVVYAYGTEARALPFSSVTSSARAGEWVFAAGGRILMLQDTYETREQARARRFGPEGFRLAKLRVLR